MCVLLCCSGRTAGRYRPGLGGGQPRVPAVAGNDAAVAGDDAAVADGGAWEPEVTRR
jgi:hypothetical protein